MMDEQFKKPEPKGECSYIPSANEKQVQNTIESGNALVLSLEDMLEALNGSYGSTVPYITNKTLSPSEAKEKAYRIKERMSAFKLRLKSCTFDGRRELGEEVDSFVEYGNYYVEEILTDWLLISDAERAIDDTHNICYKTRELIRKLSPH